MFFNFLPATPVIILLAVCLAAALIFILYYCLPLFKLGSWRRRCNEEEAPLDPDVQPVPASIIVYSRDDLPGLERLVPSLLHQDYAGDYEVIIVNEGESAQVRDFIDGLQLQYRNLYLTHTPDGARSLSRKKLALTLGIKAARGQVVLLTTANAIIGSDQWLDRMMRPFNTDAAIEVVTGVGLPVTDEDSAMGRRRRSYDYTADCATWLTAALRHHPYRGSEYNLAYRRDLFFKNKGFSRSLNMHNGDDDIFVNEIASGDNTAVQLCDTSLVRFDGDMFDFTYREEALKRAFTERFVRRGARRRMAAGPLLMWLWLCAAVAAVVLDLRNLFTLAVVAFTGLLMLAFLIPAWRAALKALEGRKLLLTIPWLTLTRPLRRTYYKMRSRHSGNRHYTWSK